MKYRITVPIEVVTEYRHYTVEADSEDDAMAKYRNGDVKYECGYLKVTSVDDDAVSVEPVGFGV